MFVIGSKTKIFSVDDTKCGGIAIRKIYNQTRYEWQQKFDILLFRETEREINIPEVSK